MSFPEYLAGPATDRANLPVGAVGCAVTQGEVAPLGAVGFELSSQTLVGGIRLGHDEKARCVLVDPMDDAGAPCTADPR